MKVIEKIREFLCRRQTWGFLVSVAVMALISVAYFYPENVDGHTLRQGDMVQGMSNGHEISEWREATGETSRWTNALFSGMPTFQISPSYPSDSLFSWVTKVYGLGLPAPSNLLFMMMLGFMILMVALNIRWELGLIGAIAWGFSTYFIIIIGAGHIWKFVTLSYIPPTIAGILLCYRGRYLAGGAMTALFSLMQLCSNHIQMTYYFGFVILAIVVAALVKSLRDKEVRCWGYATLTVVAAGALAVCGNLPNIYHTNKYAQETQRAASELAEATDAAADVAFITQYSYGRSELFTLLIPDVKGGTTVTPVAGGMKLADLASTPAGSDYLADRNVNAVLRQLPQYFGEPEATNGPVYVGALIFALFILGCIVVKGPLKWGLLTVTVLSLLLALGRNFMPLTDLFISVVPLYSKFRTPESILVIAEFTMPLLGIMGLAKWLKISRENKSRSLRLLGAAFGVPFIVCLFGAVVPSVFGSPVTDAEMDMGIGEYPSLYQAVSDVRLSMVRADCLRSALFVALGFGVMWLSLKISKKGVASGVVAAGIGVLVLVDLYGVNKRYLNGEAFVDAPNVMASIRPDAIDNAILADAQGDKHYRVLFVEDFNNAQRSYFHKTLGGYHSAKLGRYNDLINSNLIFSGPVDDMLNARYIVYQGQIIPNDYALGNGWFVDEISYVDGANAELEALSKLDTSTQAVADRQFEGVLGRLDGEVLAPRAEEPLPVNPSPRIELTEYAPNRLVYRIENDRDGIAVFSEIYFPWGWRATIDGSEAEIGRVNYVLRALRLPAGIHEVVMEFAPKSVGVTVAIATVAAILVWLWVAAAVIVPCVRRKK